MSFDLESFTNALLRLESGVAEYKLRSDYLVRAALIRYFEHAYELSHKALRRFLVATEPSPKEIKEMSFPSLIRRGCERGLMLNGYDKWYEYRNTLSMISDAGDAQKEREISDIIPEFALDARYLHDRIAERVADANGP